MDLNRQALIDVIKGTCDGKHHYQYGAKQSAELAPNQWEFIDCSGLTKYTAKRAWGINLPDGSVNQHEWCEQKALPVCRYSEVGPLDDNVLRICFLDPIPETNEPGHAFFLCSGLTFESHGRDNGKDGPDRRPWDAEVLLSRNPACYVLGNLV